jgi:hypothetical protein
MASSKLEAFKARLATMREKGQEQIGHAFQAVEVAGTAFAFGFARGKMGDENGDLDVLGIPASGAAFLGLHALGFLGVFGKHAEHVHNVADGAGAEYAAVAGMRMGAARSDFSGQRRIAGSRRRVAGSLPMGQRSSFGGFARNAVANPYVRA